MTAMSHVLGLARLLDELEDDEAFLDGLTRALGVLEDVDPESKGVLLELVEVRLDEVLSR